MACPVKKKPRDRALTYLLPAPGISVQDLYKNKPLWWSLFRSVIP